MNETVENKIVLYISDIGKTCVNVIFKNETFLTIIKAYIKINTGANIFKYICYIWMHNKK